MVSGSSKQWIGKISIPTNTVAVSLGTKTNASIICPYNHSSILGTNPTLGLEIRVGVVPIKPRQDIIGFSCIGKETGKRSIMECCKKKVVLDCDIHVKFTNGPV
ncbi:hypothetical protein POM88_001240 [Heracleum sosnowskyi]|uniref:Uncharacterized protein n=1 Tax=Heracleum sosnowskyi TaxID=360622 RepID=A0AAD8JFR5_9APIA|nr:hypothetical protein POM88_001240 [Heracleum sosnowskyi]